MTATLLDTRSHLTTELGTTVAATAAAGPTPAPAAARTVRPSPPAAGALSVAADIVDEWGRQSFPASDPPANW